MGNGNPTPSAPPVCPADIAISDCKAAMIFSDKTPTNLKASSPNVHCDFKAVWAFVPPPPVGQLSVLIYFHGHNNWVRTDASGACALPDWAQAGDDMVRVLPNRSLALKPGASCAPIRYDLGPTADADKKPIVLVPENANPINHGVECGFSAAATTALGDLVDDCFTHLNGLPKTTACGGGLYLPTKPALTDIKRLFLSGHSGGGVSLFPTAVSKLANDVPTDLCLLDCTYGEGAAEYIRFCTTNKAKLGNATGRWRFLCFHTLDKKSVEKLKEELAKTNEQRAAKNLPPIVKTDAELEIQSRTNGTQNHVNNDIIPGLKAAGFKFDSAILDPVPPGKTRGDGVNFTAANLADVEKACRLYPIVAIGVGVAHDSFANRLLPIVLKTANVV
jgi:hypothetical protein